MAEGIAERLYLDFDSFFATAEQHFNPVLRGKPVGVVPLDTLNTGCIAVSREAKARGVRFGATIREAREQVPDMIFVVARPDAYVRLHLKIVDTVESCLPVANVRSIDELVCHLLPSEAREGAELARRIKQAISKAFSPVLTCSIGIARTELLAKIAAEMRKPDGVLVLTDDDLPNLLAHLPLTDLPGISDGMETRLNAAGVHDVAGLWAVGAKQARAIWGSVEGERFWNGLHGYHVVRPKTTKRMFGHSRMLPVKWRNGPMIAECARQLTLGATRRLRRAGMRASCLTLSLRGGGLRTRGHGRPDDQRWSRDIRVPPSRDDHTFLAALGQGLSIAETQVGFKPRSVSVMLHGLVSEDDVQTDLFDIAPATETDNRDKAKWERASDVMDRLRAEHGPSAISLGPRIEVPGGYLGSKIAFGRIPDLADFSEAPTVDGATHYCSFDKVAGSVNP